MGLAHIGVFVADLEVSKKFYCETLGFILVHENYVVGEPIKLAFVQSGVCMIELVELPDSKGRTDGKVDHIAFSVNHIEEVWTYLKAKGVEFESGQITSAPGYFEKGAKYISFRGPDNERLELNEVF